MRMSIWHNLRVLGCHLTKSIYELK
jgi:hypothetical protein